MTTADKIQAWLASEHRTGDGEDIYMLWESDAATLIAHVGRLTGRVDQLTGECEGLEGEQDNIVRLLNNAMIANAEAEAQRDEAVRLLRNRQQYIHGNFHDIRYELDDCSQLGCKEVASLDVQQNVPSEAKLNGEENVQANVQPEEGPGPSCVWCGAMDTWRHTKDGKVWERGCQCPQNVQACERVSVCTQAHALGHRGGDCAFAGQYECLPHGCLWPDEGECPATVISR